MAKGKNTIRNDFILRKETNLYNPPHNPMPNLKNYNI